MTLGIVICEVSRRFCTVKQPIKSVYEEKAVLSNHFLKSSITSRGGLTTSVTVSREKTILLFNTCLAGLYAGGSQHTRRSPFPRRISQIQLSSRSRNNVS